MRDKTPAGEGVDWAAVMATIERHAEFIIVVAGAIGALVAFHRWGLPKWREAKSDARAIRDTLVGRDAVTDSITGREIHPSLPGIGKRMEHLEGVVALLSDQSARITSLEVWRNRIENDRDMERMASKVESIQLLQTIETVAKADPPDPE